MQPTAAAAAADDDEAALQDMVKEGFIGSGAQGLAGQAKKKLEAVPGERRIRRTVQWTLPDGTTQTLERIISDKDKVRSSDFLSCEVVACQKDAPFCVTPTSTL